MKIFKGLCVMFGISAIVLFTLSLFGQAPVATPVAIVVAPSPNLGDVLLGVFGLVKSWGQLGMFAGIAAALKLLIDGTKALGLFDKIPSWAQSGFVLLIGVVTVGLSSLAAGLSMPQAIGAALGSSAAAMFLHELMDDLLGLLKGKLPAPPAK